MRRAHKIFPNRCKQSNIADRQGLRGDQLGILPPTLSQLCVCACLRDAPSVQHHYLLRRLWAQQTHAINLEDLEFHVLNIIPCSIQCCPLKTSPVTYAGWLYFVHTALHIVIELTERAQRSGIRGPAFVQDSTDCS